MGFSQAEIDSKLADLRRAGYAGEIDIIAIEFVSAPPRDENFNIIEPVEPSS
jgi:hypothetical protein